MWLSVSKIFWYGDSEKFLSTLHSIWRTLVTSDDHYDFSLLQKMNDFFEGGTFSGEKISIKQLGDLLQT
jgi:hypothetical protein